MTVGEMKRLLEDMDDEMEVRIAHQPGWPLQYTVSDLIEAPIFEEEDIDDEDLADDEVLPHDDCPRVAYVVEGSQHYDNPYLPYSVRSAIGW